MPEYQRRLFTYNANICAMLWRIHKMNGVYTDVSGNCKCGSTNKVQYMEFETTFKERFIVKDNPVIYHYCNGISLNSILDNNNLWLSDIYKQNDSAERKWGKDLFIRVLKENKNEFDQSFRFFIISTVISSTLNILPTVACFSKNGDLLSQWRAYADDGKGFSIGFSSKLISSGLGVNINSVEYDIDRQYNIILCTLRGLHAIWKINGEDYEEILLQSQIFSIDLAYFKHPSFFEEQEIRIIRVLVKDGNTFVDVGGNSEINSILPLDVLERRNSNQERITYIKLPIIVPGRCCIKEIILGPKNPATIKSIKNILTNNGFEKVKVIRSNSTYK